MRFLGHSTEEPTGGPAFLEELDAIAAQGKVRIACPYFSLDVLKRLVSLSGSWELVTDCIAWLSTIRRQDRDETIAFMTQHLPTIRHCHHLHAKCIIGSKTALLGSANFTVSGIYRNIEAAVVLDEKAIVNEMSSWFEAVWMAGTQLTDDWLKTAAARIPERLAEVDPSELPPLPLPDDKVRAAEAIQDTSEEEVDALLSSDEFLRVFGRSVKQTVDLCRAVSRFARASGLSTKLKKKAFLIQIKEKKGEPFSLLQIYNDNSVLFGLSEAERKRMPIQMYDSLQAFLAKHELKKPKTKMHGLQITEWALKDLQKKLFDYITVAVNAMNQSQSAG